MGIDSAAGDDVGAGGTGAAGARGERLDSQASTASELARSQAATLAGHTSAGVLPSGARFGRYAIVRLLGQGGMGAVYEAQQESPRRSVALKVIRGSWLSAQMLRRFEHESQVLGRLQHPGIAQVYEAGSVKDERGETTPFFAMELIKGVPLTEYAAAKNLGTRERLELVARICDAVYHAHQKGVIHRDLKPGNILVDESGQPKVLDFGVARATDSDIQQTTMQTDIGQLIGTVPYMSPEQVGGDPDELDTRSDVYALGVIAYELLAARLPYDLQKKMIHEAVRVIREDEPTRLSSINRTLRGDVETIVGHALEKDKTRRYQSADALGADIRRYLKDEPIAARPASTWYQAAKFARRNKVLVGGVAATFVVLIAGMIGVSLMLKRALEAEHDLGVQVGETTAALKKAQEAEAETARANTVALRDRDRAVGIKDYLIQTLRSGNPELGGKQEETVSAAMLRGVDQLDQGQLANQPETRAEILIAVADILRSNGKYDSAAAIAKRALTLLRELHTGDHPMVATAIHTLGSTKSDGSDGKAGLELLSESLAIRQRLYPGDHADKAQSLNDYGLALVNSGKYKEGEHLLVQAVQMRRRLFPDGDKELASSLSNVGLAKYHIGRYDDAEPLVREALAMQRRLLPPDHLDVRRTLNVLAGVVASLGRRDEAIELSRESMEMARRLFRGDHPDLARAINNHAVRLSRNSQLEQAERLATEAFEMQRRLLGADHPDLAASLNNLGAMRGKLNRNEEAEQAIREAIRIFELHAETQPVGLLWARQGLADILQNVNRHAEAEVESRWCVATSSRLFEGDHDLTAGSLTRLGVACMRQGKDGEAREALDRSVAMRRRLTPNGSQNLAIVILRSAQLHLQTGDPATCRNEVAECIAMGERLFPPDHWFFQEAKAALAEATDKTKLDGEP